MSKSHDERLTITVEEAARALGISRNAAYEAANSGLIPSIRIGRRLLIPRAALEELLGVPTPSREEPSEGKREQPNIRRFVLQRDQDETGVSGIGAVAWGVVFPDGVVALRWASAWPTSVVFHDRGIEAVEAIHGHGGKTRIVWLDPESDR